MKNLNEVLRKYKSAELPVKENAVGDMLISPAYRKQMKKDLALGQWLYDGKSGEKTFEIFKTDFFQVCKKFFQHLF